MEPLAQAAQWIAAADALLITAGAGMGVDSGLPDFRGNEGLWRHYPALGETGIAFEEIANPQSFARDPQLAWGFYGHRLKLYRETEAHAGFALLFRIAACLPQGAFVLTSNVDGQFQKAGFASERIYEVHGSIHHLQCCTPCSDAIWAADALRPEIDAAACRLTSPLPRCPSCGALARPNVLMFGDWHWNEARSEAQRARLETWLRRAECPVVVELGAGLAVATVRRIGESLSASLPAPLIRINPRDYRVPAGARSLGVPMAALEGLREIAAQLDARGFLGGKKESGEEERGEEKRGERGRV